MSSFFAYLLTENGYQTFGILIGVSVSSTTIFLTQFFISKRLNKQIKNEMYKYKLEKFNESRYYTLDKLYELISIIKRINMAVDYTYNSSLEYNKKIIDPIMLHNILLLTSLIESRVEVDFIYLQNHFVRFSLAVYQLCDISIPTVPIKIIMKHATNMAEDLSRKQYDQVTKSLHPNFFVRLWRDRKFFGIHK